MEAVDCYKESCFEHGAKPVSEFLLALSSRSSQCHLQPPSVSLLTETDLLCISTVIQESLTSLKELHICGITLGTGHLLALSAGLQGSVSLVCLDLASDRISSAEGVTALFQALETSRTMQTLDLSDNLLESVQGLSTLLEESASLRTVIVDQNRISSCDLPFYLAKNETLTCFSISDNPLTFECLAAFLDALVSNKTLRFLGVKGCPQEGAAPIKENSNGLLSKQEVVILKLAHVLRYSSVASVAVDLDITAEVQLQELESTLVKHNRSLTSIRSTLIDWTKVKAGTPLGGIGRALRANQWLCQNEQLPKDQRAEMGTDIEELVAAKAKRRTPSESLSYMGITDSSINSSEMFQRMLIGKHTRSNSPTLLHSLDSAAPVVASPESRGPIQLDEVEETDSRTLGVTAETPQFSPYASTQIFTHKGFHVGKKSFNSDSSQAKPKGRHFQEDFQDPVDISQHKETQTEMSPPRMQSPSRSSRRSSNADVMKQLATMMELMERREAEMRYRLQEVAERLNSVEETSVKQREEVVETQDQLETTQRLLREVEERLEMSMSGELESRSKGALSERMDVMERKESAKVAVFEELGRELDLIREEKREDTARVKALETALKNESARTEQLVRQQNERITQLELARGKSTPPELALITEQLNLVRQEREEDKVQLQNRLQALEQKEPQVEKLKYFVSLVQKDIYTKMKKLESAAMTPLVASLDTRVQVLEDLLAKDIEKREDSDTIQSFHTTPPLSRRDSTPRLSVGSAQQFVRLEERVADIEREITNFASVKKKLGELGKRLKMTESAVAKTAKSAETPELSQRKTPRRQVRDQNQPPSDSPQSIRSTLTASKLIGTVTSELEKVHGKTALATACSDVGNDASFGRGERSKHCKTERGLGDFLPGEVESVVMGALLERTKRGKSDVRLSYRSISPLTSAKKAEPSADLQDFLRKKGFTFEDC